MDKTFHAGDQRLIAFHFLGRFGDFISQQPTLKDKANKVKMLSLGISVYASLFVRVGSLLCLTNQIHTCRVPLVPFFLGTLATAIVARIGSPSS